jgi:hypothetical protein
MPDPGDLDLPYGFKDARVVLLTLAIVGEFLQGVPAASEVPCWASCRPSVNPQLASSRSCPYRRCNLAGGLIFGWNALAIMLKAQGNYDGQCPPGEAC